MKPDIPIERQAYDAVKLGDLKLLRKLVSNDSSVVNINTPFGSLLHVASEKGFFDVVKYLVEEGAAINVNGGIVGGSPLGSAASSGHLEIVRFLFESGAFLDVSEPTTNPLFGAIYGGHTDVAKFLIESGIDTKVRYTGEAMTDMDAIAFAEERGQLDIVRMLQST